MAIYKLKKLTFPLSDMILSPAESACIGYLSLRYTHPHTVRAVSMFIRPIIIQSMFKK